MHKRSVMMALKRFRGTGPFVAKNMWQIWCRGRRKIPTGDAYAEAGAGARAFLLLWKGYPQRLLLHSASQDAADFFSSLLCAGRRAWRQAIQRRLRQTRHAAPRATE